MAQEQYDYCYHDFHGQVGWMPAFLPVAGAGRKADSVIISTLPGSPALWAGSFTSANTSSKALDLKFPNM